MKRLFILLAVLCVCLTGVSAFAAHGHYTPGVEGIQAATLPPEGFYWRSYNVWYTSRQMKKNDGANMNGAFKSDVLVSANRFVWSTPFEFLGGNLVMDVVIPFVYTDLYYRPPGGPKAMDASLFSVGDILVEPFIMAWHGSWWDIAAGVGVYVPTGYYRGRYDRPADPGLGFWTFMGTLGGTVYFDAEKTFSASVAARYEVHTEQRESLIAQGRKARITRGDDFHFEWGIGKTFNQIFTVGIAGYCNWQVSPDRGKHANSHSMYRAFGVGPEIGFNIPDWKLQIALRSIIEFENRNAPQGVITSLVFTRAF